jgi:hypothetical protein
MTVIRQQEDKRYKDEHKVFFYFRGSKTEIAQRDVKNKLQSRTDGDGGCIVAWSGCPFHRAMIGGQWAEI